MISDPHQIRLRDFAIGYYQSTLILPLALIVMNHPTHAQLLMLGKKHTVHDFMITPYHDILTTYAIMIMFSLYHHDKLCLHSLEEFPHLDIAFPHLVSAFVRMTK